MGKEVDKLDLPKGVSVAVAGVQADMTETFTQLGVAMLAAIAIVYFILVVTFREGVAPLRSYSRYRLRSSVHLLVC